MPCFVLSTFSIAPPPTPTTAKQRNKGKERKTGLTLERKKSSQPCSYETNTIKIPTFFSFFLLSIYL